MLCLAIDTSTADLIMGLVETPPEGSTEECRLIDETIICDTRAHNEQLTPQVVKLLEKAGTSFDQLDRIVVGCGPGPFTGLRVGMATAAAFGDALTIPVVGVCSHDAMAAQLGEGPLLVATDARRKEIYYTAYNNGATTFGPEVIKPALVELPHSVDTIAIEEALFSQLPSELQAARRVDVKPTATYLVEVARRSGALDDPDPAPLEPLYLRRPDAKEPKAKPRSSAIPQVEL